MSDELFRSGQLKVTSTILSVGERQYQIRQITTTEVKKDGRAWFLPIGGAFLGLGFGTYVGQAIGLGNNAAVVGLLFAVAATVGGWKLSKPKHHLWVTTSSGTADALSSKDGEMVKKVRDAISQAQSKAA